MKNQDTTRASRRGFLKGLLAGAGAAAVAKSATAQAQTAAPAQKGPVLFRRTAETERYYKSVTQQ